VIGSPQDAFEAEEGGSSWSEEPAAAFMVLSKVLRLEEFSLGFVASPPKCLRVRGVTPVQRMKVLFAVSLLHMAVGLDNGLALTPPMVSMRGVVCA
jgi:hypothetical protein